MSLEIARSPSLDLRWLNPPKDLLLPTVIRGDFGPNKYSGYYVHPAPMEDPRYASPIPLERGIIAVNTCRRSGRTHWDEAEVIAHEFRHHEQFSRGLLGESWQPKDLNWGWGDEYDRNVRLFVRRNPHEQDAMDFACRLLGDRSDLCGVLFDRLRIRRADLGRLF